jgi:DNA invertase Pin-like site-specific DNA recombinase
LQDKGISVAKAYSYLRFSTPEQMKGDSFRRQTQLAQQYAAKHKLKLDTELTLNDLGVSAFRGKNARSGALGAFLKAIDADMVPEGSVLLVESLDRVTRQDPWDALPLFQQIINAGVTIVTLHDNKTYSRTEMRANPMRILESLFVMIRANEESVTKSRRLKSAWQNKRTRAKERPLTARAPYWLQLDAGKKRFEIVTERAAIVRRMFAMTLQGIGQHRIAETLNTERVPVFGRGIHWHRSYVAKILSNRAVIGTLETHTVEYEEGKKKRKPDTVIEDYYPAVVAKETFENVRVLTQETRSPLRGRHANGTVSNIFGGLARCPRCGETMTRVSKGVGNGKPFLVCVSAKAGAGCRPYHAVPYDQVEQAFLGNAGYLIATAPAGAGGEEIDRQIDGLEASIEATRDAIANILSDIEAGNTRSERRRIRELENSIDELEKERDAQYEKRFANAGPMVAQRLAALGEAVDVKPLDRASVNLLLRQVLSRVVVNYLSGDLEFHWKHGSETSAVFSWPKEQASKDSNNSTKALRKRARKAR